MAGSFIDRTDPTFDDLGRHEVINVRCRCREVQIAPHRAWSASRTSHSTPKSGHWVTDSDASSASADRIMSGLRSGGIDRLAPTITG